MGKLAKPQRSRKHKKMKAIDPFYVGNRTTHKNAASYDRAPDTVQELSQHPARHKIHKVNSSAKHQKLHRQKLPRNSAHNNSSADDIEGVPEFRRRVGERQSDFMLRVDTETFAVIQQSQFDDKFNATDKTDAGQTTAADRREKRKSRLQEKKRKLVDRKKTRREDRSGGFAHLKDEVQFGEVVTAPPVLTAKPRHTPVSSQTGVVRNVKHHSLLLSDMLTSDASGATCRPADKRRRCMAERVVLDAERQRAITLYRQMKAARTTPHI